MGPFGSMNLTDSAENANCHQKLVFFTGNPSIIPSSFNCDFSALEKLTSTYQEHNGTNWTTIYSSLNETCLQGPGSQQYFLFPKLTINLLRKICSILSSLLICFSIGTKIKLTNLITHLKRPFGIIIGFISQYGFMPIITLLLTKLFEDHLTIYQKLVVFLCGCAPGGNLSSLLVYWTDGDLDLSVGMTLASQLVCAFMVPFLIEVYFPVINSGANGIKIEKIPYNVMFSSVVIFTVPLFVGYMCKKRWRCSRIGDSEMEGDTHNDTRTDETDIVNRISSVFSKIGIILIIVSVVLVFFQRRPGKFWPNGVIKLAKVFQVVILIPFFGMLIGFCFSATISTISSKIFKIQYFKTFGVREYKTVAIETGVQNLVLPMMIVQLNFSCPAVLVEVVSVGLMFFFSQILAISTVYLVNKWVSEYFVRRKLENDCGNGQNRENVENEINGENGGNDRESVDFQTRVKTECDTKFNHRKVDTNCDFSEKVDPENNKLEKLKSENGKSDIGYISNSSSDGINNNAMKMSPTSPISITTSSSGNSSLETSNHDISEAEKSKLLTPENGKMSDSDLA